MDPIILDTAFMMQFDVAFNRDWTRLASTSYDRTVRVWDARSGKELCTLMGHTSQVNSVAFSPDGTRLASAGDNQIVKLWDVASGQELRTLLSTDGEIWCHE